MPPIDIRTYKNNFQIPLLVLVDPQQEYLCQERPLGIEKAALAVANIQRLLAYAREQRLPVAFVRWSQSNKLFRHGSPFSNWVDGCTPCGADMVFERAWPSCYANAEFSEMMNNGGGSNAVVAGFTGAIACLATIVEGAGRQHHLTFIHDASASHAHHEDTEAKMHASATSLISLFAPVMTTEEWLGNQGAMQRMGPRRVSDHAFG